MSDTKGDVDTSLLDDLFAEADEGTPGEPTALFDEPEDDAEGDDDEGKPKAKTVPLTRLNQALDQNRKLKADKATADEKWAEAQAEKARLEGIVETFGERYGDNRTTMEQDHAFMSELDALATSQDPNVVKLVEAVLAGMKAKPPTVAKKETKKVEDTKTDEPTKVDKATQRILERDADRAVKEALPGVKPAMVKIFQKHVRSEGDLTDVTPESISESVRAYIAENGLTKEDVYAPTADEKPKKPTNASGKSVAAVTPKEKPAEKDKPKNFEEFQADRNARFAAIVASAE